MAFNKIPLSQLHNDDILAELNAPMNPNHLLPRSKSVAKKLGYVYEPDKLALSYSRRQTLNRCARLFQLREIKQRKSRTASIDTSYGSAFGAGIQELFRSGDIQRSSVALLSNWDYPEFEDIYGKKHDKSLASCMETLEAFYTHIYPDINAEYELADLNGRSGIELFVYLGIGESFSYQIHIDLILQHRITRALAVIECKTSGKAAVESDWGNSSQTLGYYVILETLSKMLGVELEPFVYYICSKSNEYHNPQNNYGFQILPYVKTPNATLDFVQEVMSDVRRISDHIEHDYFPKNGGACTVYSRPCEFYGSCDMTGLDATVGEQYESLTLADCDFVLSMDDILNNIEQNHLTS